MSSLQHHCSSPSVEAPLQELHPSLSPSQQPLVGAPRHTPSSATGETMPSYLVETCFASGQTQVHSYTSAGTYTATIRVRDLSQTTVLRTVNIQIVSPSSDLIVGATGNPTSGAAPLTVSFGGSASGGTPPYSYNWAFGDGQSSTQQSPSHIYQNAGTYTAVLTVRDYAGITDTASTVVTVTSSSSPAPAPSPTPTPSPTPAPSFWQQYWYLILAAVAAAVAVPIAMRTVTKRGAHGGPPPAPTSTLPRPEQRFCANCNAVLSSSERFCPACGKPAS